MKRHLITVAILLGALACDGLGFSRLGLAAVVVGGALEGALHETTRLRCWLVHLVRSVLATSAAGPRLGTNYLAAGATVPLGWHLRRRCVRAVDELAVPAREVVGPSGLANALWPPMQRFTLIR